MDDETGDTNVAHDDANPGQTGNHWNEYRYPSVAIVDAVAAATDRSATELPPLHQDVDPEALDRLLTGGSSPPVHLQFSYAGTVVSVRSDGTLMLTAE